MNNDLDTIDAIFSASGTSVALNIDGANIDSSPVGAGTPSTGAFTTLSATGIIAGASLDISGDVDIDGTTNLDVVDIDGALTQDGGAVFNEASADLDFRVESVGNANALFVDGGTDAVGIGIGVPLSDLHLHDEGGLANMRFSGTAASVDTFTIGQGIAGVTNAGFSIYDVEATANRLVIDTAGNFGIGINPTHNFNLSAAGGVEARFASTDGDCYLQISSDTDEGQDSVLQFLSGTSAKGSITYDHNATAASQAMIFKAGDNAVSAMTILGDGNISVGFDHSVAYPSDANFTVSNAGTNGMEFSVEAISGENRLLNYNRTSSTYQKFTTIGSELKFNIGASEAMRLDSSRRLLVGLQSGNQKMVVADDALNNTVFKAQNTNTSSPYGMIIEFSGATPDNNTNYFLNCGDTGADRMKIYSDGDVWTADAGTLTSDRSLKTDIADANSKLADINQLQVKNFKWITDYHPNKQNKNIGFIADEFETVFPSLVTEHENPLKGEDGTVKSIRYGALIPILVKAVQELSAEVEQLKQQAHEKCDN